MSPDLSSIKLRNFLTSCGSASHLSRLASFLTKISTHHFFAVQPVIPICLFAALPLFGCSSTNEGSSKVTEAASIEPSKSEHSDTPAAIPPWQLWSEDPIGHPGLSAAAALERNGQLETALKSYRDVELRETPGREREEAFARRIGVTLKLGRSQEALQQITAHLQEEKLTASEISPLLALLAAFSYQHQDDLDQSFAWFGVAYKRAQGRGAVARRSVMEIQRTLQTLSTERFAKAQEVWQSDTFIGPKLGEERARRAAGGQSVPSKLARWFDPQTYGAVRSAAELREADLSVGNPTTSGAKSGALGVILPLTGKFAQPAGRVKQGIELARSEFGAGIEIVYGDSSGEPRAAQVEYERLVSQGISLVLGDLLVKTTEEIAQSSKQLGVPVITFTKRPGVTTLSPRLFRLGSTVENQLEEVTRYSVQELKKKNIAILLATGDSNAEEYKEALPAAVRAGGGVSVGVVVADLRDSAAVSVAINQLSLFKPEAIFVAEELDRAVPFLRALKSSPLSGVSLLGSSTWGDAIVIRSVGSLLEGAVYATPFNPTSAQPIVAGFVSRFKEVYGHEPDILAAQGYDAAKLAFSALKNANNSSTSKNSSESLMAALEKADTVDGVTGKLTVEKSREVSRRMSVIRMHKGEAIEVMRAGNITGFLPND